MKQSKKILIPIGVGILALFILAGWYIQHQFTLLSNRVETLSMNVATLNGDLSSTTLQLQGTITKTQTDLSNAVKEQQQNVGVIQQKLGTYQQQVGTITGTVDTLQKLSKTDPQLLAKYSKVFFLSENYAPERLSEVPEAYKYSNTKTPTVQSDVLPHLQTMIDDANKAEIKLFVFSGYRSFAEQKALKSDYRITYGAGTANSFSADQGYSEHQLGTTVDLITSGLGGQLDGFENTPAYSWLLSNAYKYGFIISYPKDNKYYVFEPWHWRYVGIKLATDLHTAGANFYDWDQRKIDTYLVSVF